MATVICYASRCLWNDNKKDECTKPTICLKPNVDYAEPAYCDDYSDPWYEIEGEE